MSEPDTVDRTTLEETTGRLVLVIQEDRSWDDPDTMHRQLREKIKGYVRHLRSGEFAAKHGRSPENAVIRLVYSDPPGERTVEFLDRVRYELSKLGIEFQHELDWFGDISSDSPLTVHGWNVGRDRRAGPGARAVPPEDAGPPVHEPPAPEPEREASPESEPSAEAIAEAEPELDPEAEPEPTAGVEAEPTAEAEPGPVAELAAEPTAEIDAAEPLTEGLQPHATSEPETPPDPESALDGEEPPVDTAASLEPEPSDAGPSLPTEPPSDLEPEIPIAEPPTDVIDGYGNLESMEWSDIVGDPEIIANEDPTAAGAAYDRDAWPPDPVPEDDPPMPELEIELEGTDPADATEEFVGSADVESAVEGLEHAASSMWPEEEFGDLSVGAEARADDRALTDLDALTRELAPSGPSRRPGAAGARSGGPRPAASESRPRPFRGLLAALGAAIAAGFGWPLFAIASGGPATALALVVGAFVGFNVRLRGGGRSVGYRLMAVFGTLLGCALGGLLSSTVFRSREEGILAAVQRIQDLEAALETLQLFYGLSGAGLVLAGVLLSGLVSASGKKS